MDQLIASSLPNRSGKVTGQQLGLMSLRNQRVSDNHDPFVMMNRHVMEPIIALDRLEILRQNKIEFDVLLHPKDIKTLTKKDEMLRQRVHLEAQTEESGFVIEINMDPNFEQIRKEAELESKDQSPGISPELNMKDDEEMRGDDESSNENNVETELDAEMKDTSVPTSAKIKKKRKKTSHLSSANRRSSNALNRKSFQTHLPSSLSDCTWLENTTRNVQILEKKN
jgi:hypothetical protein